MGDPFCGVRGQIGTQKGSIWNTSIDARKGVNLERNRGQYGKQVQGLSSGLGFMNGLGFRGQFGTHKARKKSIWNTKVRVPN